MRKIYRNVRAHLSRAVAQRRGPSDTKIEKFVFIVTYGRSGSTLLQSLIGRTPGFYMAGENYHALRGLALAYQSALKAKLEQGQEPRGPDDPWHGAQKIDPARFGQKLAGSFLEEVIAPPPSVRAVGFKGIRWFAEPEELEQLISFAREFFPRAHFVFNIRLPKAVANSSWWAEEEPHKVVNRVAAWNQIAVDYVARHPSDCLLVSYDEYVAEPAKLSALFTFLGEPFDLEQVNQVLAKKLTH